MIHWIKKLGLMVENARSKERKKRFLYWRWTNFICKKKQIRSWTAAARNRLLGYRF
jgi:hypothetical protein